MNDEELDVEESKILRMKSLWCSALAELGLTSEYSTQYFYNTMELYKETHRKYHTYEHIYTLCLEYEKHKDKLENSLAVLFAIFFHDRIYSVYAIDGANEKNSASTAQKFFTRAAREISFTKINEIKSLSLRVSELVLLTIDHACSKVDNDAKIFLDMDMLILSTDRAGYEVYCSAIRDEFKHIPDRMYNLFRSKKFLQKTLDSERIYLSDVYAEREERARLNLKAELDVIGL